MTHSSPTGERHDRLAYDDPDPLAQLRADGEATGRHLGLDRGRRLDRIAEAAAGPSPSLHFRDYPREVPKPEIEISEAAARLAAALHLHLD